MPNHITNIVKSNNNEHLKTLLIDGVVDFNSVFKSPDFPSDSIPSHVDLIVDRFFEVTLPAGNDDTIAMMKLSNSVKTKAVDLSDEHFELALKMIRIKRKTGYSYWHEHNTKVWGTKWNAYDQEIKEDCLRFDTAWSHPFPVIEKLSKLNPETEFYIQYADEDIGSNWGEYTIKNGVITNKNIAKRWNEMSESEQAEARRLACQIKYPGESAKELGYTDDFSGYLED